ncbi:MAG: ParB/RepB/Spo0J family partition protein [Clostridia bacterium]|nr:ParB/RepB/Spo0J family partition protein [Clostridia bacterium]
MKKKGLGRGLDVLLPTSDEVLEKVVQEIPVGDIDPTQDQPRRTFKEETLGQLAQSIREAGVLSPLLVVEQNGRYRIVAGERRYRAARMAGLDTVPCIVRDMDMIQQMEAALIENLQREDLNPMEEAQAVKALMNQCGYTQEAAAQKLGKSRPALANLLRLLTLPEGVQEMVRLGQLSTGHAKVLAGLDSDKKKIELARETVKNDWSVRQLEKMAQSLSQPPKPKAAPKPLTVELKGLEEKLRETLGVRAAIAGTPQKGKITLTYYSENELEQLYEVLERLG